LAIRLPLLLLMRGVQLFQLFCFMDSIHKSVPYRSTIQLTLPPLLKQPLIALLVQQLLLLLVQALPLFTGPILL
jgi:hypothetical protein